MAKTTQPAPAPSEPTPATVEAFVLRDCGFGKAGEVIKASAADAATGAEQGMLDLAKSAIEYAKANKG